MYKHCLLIQTHGSHLASISRLSPSTRTNCSLTFDPRKVTLRVEGESLEIEARCHHALYSFLCRYFIFDFDAPPQSVQLILSQLRSNNDVIRASLMKAGKL